jgi:hypothetical protein
MDKQPDYEALCITLYTYRFGSISFVELIEQLEQALDISHQTEILHLNSSLDDGEGEHNSTSLSAGCRKK